MNEDLEAFKDIKQLISILEFAGSKDRQWVNEELSIIENELKDYYALKKECEEAKWYQEHKALEIIKESGCSLEHILLIERTKNYEEYDAQFDKYLENRYEPFKFELRKSKEEYDSLKKVLL